LEIKNPGVNFINILRTAFTIVDPESIKKIDNVTVFLTLLGSGRVKVVLRTLMKLSPDRLSYAIGIWARKSCAYNIDEIEPR
jgi:hypothetical protein